MSVPLLKVMIEGIQVPVRSVTRIQVEGEPSRIVLNLWPTNKGSLIARGSHVVVYRWENNKSALMKNDINFKDANVNGVWELFFDGYVDRKPNISRRESRSLVVYAVNHINRLSSVYLRTTSIGAQDFGILRDKAFMGINLQPNDYFTVDIGTPESSSLVRMKALLAEFGVAEGLISLSKDAINYDDLYARVAATTNLYNRIHGVENKKMSDFVGRENLVNIIAGQIDSMASTTTLMQIINQLMYQSLYTFISVPSPAFSMKRQVPMDPVNFDFKKENSDVVMYQYIYKPQLFFSAPIKSNIIFPFSIDSMEPIRSSVNQPTRVAVVGSPRVLGRTQGRVFLNKVYFPESIGKSLAIDMDITDGPEFGTDKYTEEELLEDRVVPREIRMPFPESLLNTESDASGKSIADVYGQYAFFLEKNTSEPIQVQVAFDPYLVCGISGVILDEQFGFILGRYRTITDIIDVDNGNAKTTVEVANVRIVPKGTKSDAEFHINGYDELFTGESSFFDESFNDQNINDSFYKPYFGAMAVHNDKDRYYSRFDGYDPIAGALAGLLSMSGGISGDHIEEFIADIKYRPVVTESEYVNFLNIDPLPEKADRSSHYTVFEVYNSKYSSVDKPYDASGKPISPFMKERQDIVKNYTQDIREGYLAKLA